MTFRKDPLLFAENILVYIVLAISFLIVIPMVELELSLVFAFFALLLIIFTLIAPRQYNEFITINENGISCHKSKEQIWAYAWDDIVGLKKGSLYLMPSVGIMVSSPCRALDSCEEFEHARYSGHYFQLSKTAKNALKQYYKYYKPRYIKEI